MSTVHVVKFNCNISCTFGRTQTPCYIYRDQLVFSTSCTGWICYALFSWPMLFLLFCFAPHQNVIPWTQEAYWEGKKRNKCNLLSDSPVWFWNLMSYMKGVTSESVTEWQLLSSVVCFYLFFFQEAVWQPLVPNVSLELQTSPRL